MSLAIVKTKNFAPILFSSPLKLTQESRALRHDIPAVLKKTLN